ncbi:hypothetical protein ACQCN2_04605 [Brevibacillus ginsengisoli]|uniref:hypothetical protein n=1 Tax=Brevibacillus ginsengisoli TaxID=363854 RepID=UPI003CF0BE3D
MHLVYKLLNRSNVEASTILREVECSQEELHVRKLVDASLFTGTLYEHTSNALEELEVVYVEQPKIPPSLPKHHQHVYGYTVEYYEQLDDSLRLVQSKNFADFASIVTRLLDHYTVLGGKDYELTYTILDENRGCVLIYVKPE